MRAAIEEMFQPLDEDGDLEDTTCVAMEKEEEDLMLLDDGINFFPVPTGTRCPHLIFNTLFWINFNFLLLFFMYSLFCFFTSFFFVAFFLN